jgi:hypothetical protein
MTRRTMGDATAARSATTGSPGRLELTAYRLHHAPLPLVCAPGARAWMDATDQRYAYRCLPLLIANQSGWFVLNDQPIECLWDGTREASGVRIRQRDPKAARPSITSHFGEGIITWHIPYLFRTPPGYNLLVRGPANWPKDGVQALEGVVEADWTSATFTMNWKITRPRRWIRFGAGEPICMVVPQRRGELESFETRVADLASNPELHEAHRQWSESRSRFLVQLRVNGSDAAGRKWQKDYFQGRSPGADTRTTQHQTVLKLRPFSTAGTPAGSREPDNSHEG